MNSRGHRLLNALILAGLVAGVVVGFLLFRSYQQQALSSDEIASRIQWMYDLGDLLLVRPLKMMIIPLVFTSVVVGITSIGDPSKLGKVGGATLLYYFATMLIAAVLGVVLVTSFSPGVGVEGLDLARSEAQYENIRQTVEGAPKELESVWINILHQLLPTNVFEAAAQGQPLPIISFSILFGLALATIGPKGEPVVRVINAAFEAVMTLVGWILWMTPIGVFLLVTWTMGKLGGEAIQSVGKYMGTVFVGLAIHGFITLPLVLWIFGRTNPLRFLWLMRPALVTAFGTDSSSATLPVTMETAEEYGEVSKRASGFVLPLGSTINMDGTALYEAVAVIFLFQLYGIELGIGQVAVVALTATLAAVGAAGIPSAGLVTMVIVIEAVNSTFAHDPTIPILPLTAIGVIIGVDRILDMCRTTVNVWGDLVGAKIITRIAPDEPEPVQS